MTNDLIGSFHSFFSLFRWENPFFLESNVNKQKLSEGMLVYSLSLGGNMYQLNSLYGGGKNDGLLSHFSFYLRRKVERE